MDYNPFFSWKTLLYADKCRAILDGNFKPPVTLHVYPTNECNNNCRFCIMKEERENNPDSLSRDVFGALIDSANNMNIQSIHISGGGEPTLFKHLDLFEFFNGYKVLSSNGRKLTRETAELFDRIRISINAGSPEVYTEVNGTSIDDWCELMSRIEALSKRPRSYELGLGFVADFANWQDIPRVCMLAQQYELDFVHIRPAYYPKGSEEEIKVRHLAEKIYRASEHAKDVCELKKQKWIFSISEKFEGFWTERQYNDCLASPLHAVVTATGELTVCQDVFIRFGDLNHSSLEEIWGSADHKSAIAAINPDECPRCVMNRSNEIMEEIFLKNKIKKELL